LESPRGPAIAVRLPDVNRSFPPAQDLVRS
jgi:hypothetical protein